MNFHFKRTALIGLASLLGVGVIASAQRTQPPTQDQIDARVKANGGSAGGQVTDVDIAKVLSEKAGEIGRAQAAALRQVQGAPGLPPRRAPDVSVRKPAPVDIEAFYDKQVNALGEHHEDGDPVMVFVSFSMPYESLKRTARDAAKAKIPLVFQGLKYGLGKENMRRGIEALTELRKLGADISIHPDLFEYYDVQKIPAVVVAGKPREGCSDPAEAAAPYVKVYGDVTIDFALEHLEARKDELGAIARRALAKIQDN